MGSWWGAEPQQQQQVRGGRLGGARTGHWWGGAEVGRGQTGPCWGMTRGSQSPQVGAAGRGGEGERAKVPGLQFLHPCSTGAGCLI